MAITTASLLAAANKEVRRNEIEIERLNRELIKTEDEKLLAIGKAWDIEKEKDRLAEELNCVSIKYNTLKLEHSAIVNKGPWWKFW